MYVNKETFAVLVFSLVVTIFSRDSLACINSGPLLVKKFIEYRYVYDDTDYIPGGDGGVGDGGFDYFEPPPGTIDYIYYTDYNGRKRMKNAASKAPSGEPFVPKPTDSFISNIKEFPEKEAFLPAGLSVVEPQPPSEESQTKKPEMSQKKKQQEIFRKLEETCGTVPSYANFINISSPTARYSELPWQVLLSIELPGHLRSQLDIGMPLIKCGGVIISKNRVMTSASCIVHTSPDKISISINSGEQIRVNRIEKHPDFREKSSKYDLAILYTSEIEFSKRVVPICLPKKYCQYAISDDDKHEYCITSGFGSSLSEEGKVANYGGPLLYKTAATLITGSRCSAATKYPFNLYQERIPTVVLNNQFACTKTNQNTHCITDNGGPLVCMAEDGRYQLSGILAFHSNCKSPSSNVDAFVRPCRMMKWIKRNLSRNI